MISSSDVQILGQVRTREIFGNIGTTSTIVFYVLTAICLGVFILGVRRRHRLWSIGRRLRSPRGFRTVARNFVTRILMQRSVRGRGLASLAHILMFSGVIVLALGSALVAVEHYSNAALGRPASRPLFHEGRYYAIFEVVTDTFGLALILGAGWFALRRIRGNTSIGHTSLGRTSLGRTSLGRTILGRTSIDAIILGAMLFLGVSGYAVEGLRILREETVGPEVSYVGYGFAQLFATMGIQPSTAGTTHFVLWWCHSVIALASIAAVPYTRLMHIVAGSMCVATQDEKLGFLEHVSVEEVETSGRFGVGRIQDFSTRQLTELDACVSCGRCEDACPAFSAGKPLSPRDLVQATKTHLDEVGPAVLAAQPSQVEHTGLHATREGGAIAAETLWACTTCSACTEVCPLGVSPVHLITDMRRHLIGVGELRGPPAQALQRSQRQGNPWGLPQRERMLWSEGLRVPTVKENPEFEILYWVGCAAAYDQRTQSIARAVVQLLEHAGVNYAVLGPEERCTGEAARRMGDEFVYQELADDNVRTMGRYGVRRILTHCPHCLNSLRQDYPQRGGHYEVVHHTAFLEELIAAGRLPREPKEPWRGGVLTYHDPCYLARVQDETTAPRNLLRMAMGDATREHVEPDNHGCETRCCGAGGGRMWFDDPPESRIGADRIEELVATGADTIAVGCPFCLRMATDGAANQDRPIEVLDVAEVVLQSLSTPTES